MTKKENKKQINKKLGVSETPSISKPERSSSEPRAFLFNKNPQAVYGRQLGGFKTLAGTELSSQASLFYLRLVGLPEVPTSCLSEAECEALNSCSAFTILGSNAMALAVALGLLEDSSFWSYLQAGHALVGVSLPDLTFVFRDPKGSLTWWICHEGRSAEGLVNRVDKP